MTWALKRQIFYLIIVILIFGTGAYFVIKPHLNKAPTCTDGKENGDELGVDCGGSCVKACVSQVDNVSLLWARAFRIVPGRYNAVAYLTNHNKNTAVSKIKYRFRFADKNNIYIGKREGYTFIPPTGNFAIFESAVDMGNSVPVYVTFEFTERPEWVQVPEDKIEQLKILTSKITLKDETTEPRLQATVKNNSLFTVPEVNVVAILYDASHNVVSTSRTYLEVLKPEGSAEIHFTWPEPFSRKVVEQEIIPMYNILSVKLK